ncbi:diacylglycerol/lipid kinase family protein [Maribellus mangrovi]|uniref:diacylglycerol/lipid kinase family protein n=1 Tax=Maribellus mangrovi TaxID=3133146 RepID=UPI0030EB4A64
MPENKSKKDIDILFIINPISGDKDKSDLKNEINEYLKEKDISTEFYFTTGENDAKQITQILKGRKFGKIVVAGGDGTCNLVGRLVLNRETAMGIIPAGSANGLATELDLPIGLQDSLDCIVKGKSKKVDALRINNEHICLHLSDIGFNARVIDRFEKGELRGMAGYANSFIGELVETQPSSFQLKFEEETKEKSAFMIVLANATKFGTGAVINPKGKLDDGMFEVVVMNPNKVIHFLEMIVPFYTQKIHTLDFVHTYSCRKIVIENPRHQNVQIDGEFIGKPETISVEILPQALEIIVP